MKIDSKVWWRIPRQIRFLMVGGYNTAFGYVAFTLLFLLLRERIHYLVIAVIAHMISVTSAFIVYRNLVFTSPEPWAASFIRFNLSQLAAVLFGVAGLYSLVHFGHLSPLVAQALLILPSVLITYTLHRHFSFRHRVDIT